MAEETRKCTGCGCTEDQPCLSECARVRKDLCSECLPMEKGELAVLMDLLMVTSANLADLPWHAFRRALDDPGLAEELLPPRLAPLRRQMMLRHLWRFADLAAQWRTAVLESRKEMQALGPQVEAATPGDLPPPPRILRP